MAAQPPNLQFYVRIGDGEYGQLIIEAIRAVPFPPGRTLVAGGKLLPPPTQNVLLGSSSQAADGDLAERGKNVMAAPWVVWVDSVYRFLKNLGFSGGPTIGPTIQVTAWSIREIDVEWYGEIPISAPLLHDQASFTPDQVGYSRFGRGLTLPIVDTGGSGYTQETTTIEIDGVGAGGELIPVITGGALTDIRIKKRGWYEFVPAIRVNGIGTLATAHISLQPWVEGQYFLINDETVREVDGEFFYSYEICRITNIDGAFTIERGLLGTEALDHLMMPDGSAIKFYLLVPGKFSWILGPEPPPQGKKFLWDNMCVCRVEAQIALEGQPVAHVDLIPTATTVPARPGRRSMGGAAYINLRVDGDYVAGDNSNKADAAQSWETLRYVQLKADVVLTDTTVYVCWVEPLGIDVYLVGSLIILAGETSSGDSFGAQMPGVPGDTTIVWPPNMLKKCSGGLNIITGDLNPSMGFTNVRAQFKQDGYFRFVVNEGTGTNLRAVVQT